MVAGPYIQFDFISVSVHNTVSQGMQLLEHLLHEGIS
jgi:hypothetical protein